MENKIVIAGAGILDVLVKPVKEEVFHKGSVPVETIRLSTGGDALNESIVLARLKNTKPGDAAVRLLTVLGEDEAGKTVASHCEEEGISMELTVQDPGAETGINIVMVQEDGQRSFFTNPKSTLRGLALEHFPEKFPEDAGIFCLASMFVSPKLGNEEMAEVFRRAKQQGMLVCADMTKCKNQETVQDIREALSYVDYLFANEEEASLVTGESDLQKMAERLWGCGVKNVIIKCGNRGCYVKAENLEQQFPAVPGTNCVDTTGAGDAFAAGFLYALSEGKETGECVRWANACGSLATEAVGACVGIRDRKQVLERLRRYSEII